MLSPCFVDYTEFVVFAKCPPYGLYKSNTMLKHCGGSPKWLEAQSLQETLLDGSSMPLDSLTIGKPTSGGWSVF